MNKKYTLATIREIIQDNFLLYLIFNIQSKISNPLLKEMYGYLGIYCFSIYMHELIKNNLIDKNKIPPETINIIDGVRERFTKKRASASSHTIQNISEEMGIDFNHYFFDMHIIVERNDTKKLYTVDFSIWDVLVTQKEDIKTISQLIGIPESIIGVLLSEIHSQTGADANGEIETICTSIADKIESEIHPVKYLYASGVFFKYPEPDEQDKYFILFYYTYIYLLCNIFKYIPVSTFKIGDFIINIRHSALKLRAVFIESIGLDIRTLDSPMIKKINREVCQFVPQDIFKRNRKLRNNIHYSKTDLISDEEYNEIELFQDKYFSSLLCAIDSCIKYNTGTRYHLIRWIADHTDYETVKQPANKKSRLK